ncbi:UNVERIFIED_CONTAM: hypothetical protein RMT77_008804 [Armadillidium vulgare]
MIVYLTVFEIAMQIMNAYFLGYIFYLVYHDKLTAIFCKRRASNVELRKNTETNHMNTFKQQMKIYLSYRALWILNFLVLIKTEGIYLIIINIVQLLQGVYFTIFILYTSRDSLVIPIYENLSRSLEEFSSAIRERKSYNSSAKETSEISLKYFEQKSFDSIATKTSEIFKISRTEI